MSVLLAAEEGWFVDHLNYINAIYRGTIRGSDIVNLSLKTEFFQVLTPFLKDEQGKLVFLEQTREAGPERSVRKRKRSARIDSSSVVHFIESQVQVLLQKIHENNFLAYTVNASDYLANNVTARKISTSYYETLKNYPRNTFTGGNTNNHPLVTQVDSNLYLFPPACRFISCKVERMAEYLSNERFDFILLDPPWMNKFVKRRKLSGYTFMDNSSFRDLGVQNLLEDSGLVAVWVTNAPSHIKAVQDQLFPAWGLNVVATWYWVKVTNSGELICPFSAQEGDKQPFERIIFGAKQGRILRVPESGKCIVSVPSSIHSHKPPLGDVLKLYLPENPKCLELFARYLLPNWFSVGDQVLSLQLLEFYTEESTSDPSTSTS